jgi:subtilase family serine protease
VKRPLLALLLAVLLPASAPAVPAAGLGVVALPASLPSWAVASARVGTVPGDEVVSFQVVLPWRSPARAQAAAVAASDPASASYGQFLSPEQWRAAFAPSGDFLSQVAGWLRSAGLEVGAVPANRLVVPARGPASVVGRALRTTFGRYAVGGLALRAPDAAPRVPAALAALGIGLRGLDQGAALLRTGPDDPAPTGVPRAPGGPAAVAAGAGSAVWSAGAGAVVTDVADPPPALPEEPATPADVQPPAAVAYGTPCSAYHGATIPRGLPVFRGRKVPAVACGTAPQAVQAAYGVSALLKKKVDGAGQTVVMVGSHAIKPLPSDVSTWSKRHGLPALRPGQLRQVSYPGAYQTPVYEPVLRPEVWAVQAATLFETVHTVAPGADLLYVGTTSSFDLATGTLLAVDGGWGDAVINGWYSASESVPSPEWTLIDRIAEQAAATGISLLFAAGDLGDGVYAGGGGGTVYPASEPMATAVGATSLLLGRGGRYLRELAWAKSQWTLVDGAWEETEPVATYYRGTGGGTSTVHAQPSYQKGVVPAALAERNNGTPGRTVPDLAVMGDGETGMPIGYTQHFPDGANRYAERRVASSTASTALVAGLIALANDRRGSALGFVNPRLYAIWKAKRSAFRDIVRYGRAGAGVRVDFKDGATAKSGKTYVLKVFEAYGDNVPRPGYDTAAGLGSPAPSLVALL